MYQAPINSIRNQHILISPLNWGLGHVTRTIPIIKSLNQHNEVYICCDAEQEQIYRHYFPEQWYVPHEGYPFRFNGKGLWMMDFIKRIGSLLEHHKQEQKKVEELVDKFNIDLVIADQRFGFKSARTRNILITHQVNLPLSPLFVGVQWWNKSLIRKFDEIWVPDTKNNQFAGKLSRSNDERTKFIGTCSRFDYDAIDRFIPRSKTIRYLGVISGPQPYNQLFFNQVYAKIKASNRYSVIIVPKGVTIPKSSPEQVKIIQSPNHDDFLNLLLKTEIIISRAGYSTIMDLVTTENKAILVPTRRQYEQQYLAKLHADHPHWQFVNEKQFNQLTLD